MTKESINKEAQLVTGFLQRWGILVAVLGQFVVAGYQFGQLHQQMNSLTDGLEKHMVDVSRHPDLIKLNEVFVSKAEFASWLSANTSDHVVLRSELQNINNKLDTLISKHLDNLQPK